MNRRIASHILTYAFVLLASWSIFATEASTQQPQPGLYRIVNVNSGKSLEIANGNPSDRVPLVQGTYTGAPYQHWRLVPFQGCFVIVNSMTGKVLDIPFGDREEGVQIEQCGWNGQPTLVLDSPIAEPNRYSREARSMINAPQVTRLESR